MSTETDDLSGCDRIRLLDGLSGTECCGSCHSDNDDGYEMCWVVLGDDELDVCCSVATAFRKSLKRT